MTISGECFCGAVTYEVTGKLRDARSCHCSRCRKAFSAQASAYALVDPAQFKWLTGQELLTSYIGRSGAGLQFCSQCGSTLCGVVDGAVHGVTLGCVNDDPGIEIEQLPDGRTRYHYRSDNHDWHITGGKSKSITIRAKLRPGSTLKVAQPFDSDPDKTK